MHTYDLQESGSQSLHLGFQQMLLSSDFTLRRGISAPLKSSLWLESYRVSVGFDQHLGSDFALSMLAQTLITRSFQQDSNGSEIRVVNETSMADSLFKETSFISENLDRRSHELFKWGEVELGTVTGVTPRASMSLPYMNIIWGI